MTPGADKTLPEIFGEETERGFGRLLETTCDGKYEYSDDEHHRCYRWYGNSGTARLLGLAAVPMLQVLLAALLAVKLRSES